MRQLFRHCVDFFRRSDNFFDASLFSLTHRHQSETGTSVVMPSAMLEEDLKEKLIRLFDRMSTEAIALLALEPEVMKVSTEPLPEWMTATQLARYWQLVNAKGEPTSAAIMK